ncbi:MAG TPA: hypothetical protein VGI98_07060 [Candidatus Limnocylindrales bacterium]
MNEQVPPGLIDQVRATFAAAKRLVRAHVELGKAEAGDIVDAVKRVVGLVLVALALVVAAGLLLFIGGMLFLGEWLFGSIGWGVLLGFLLFLDLALNAGLAALDVRPSRLGLFLLIGVVVGVAVALGLAVGLGWESRLAAALGTLLALIVWPILAGVGVARRGIDGDALKAKFTPDATIDETKETIEWVRARLPLAPKS